MTSSDPTPSLLPGRSAAWLQRVYMNLNYVALPGFLLCLVSVISNASSSRQFAWELPVAGSYLAIVYAGILLCVLRFTRRTRQEASAGYTTAWNSESTLPQLDARTGEIIRKAGDPYVKRKDWERRDNTASPNSVVGDQNSNEDAKPSWWSNADPMLPSVVIAVVGFGGLAGSIIARGDGFGIQLFIAAVLAGLGTAVVYAAILAVCGGVVNGRLRRMAAAAPGRFGFVFGNSRNYGAAFFALTGTRLPVAGSIAHGVSADTRALTIWHGNPPNEVAQLAWERVTSIQSASVPGSNNSAGLLALVTFTSDSGDLATLPLAFPKVDSFPIPSKAQVQWIVDQLNALRAGRTRPHVI